MALGPNVRIRIGDIEIDGQMVRIGGQPMLPTPVSQALTPQPAQRDPVPADSLKMLPVSGGFLVRSGAALLLLGIVFLAVVPISSIASLIFHVFPLVFGVGTLGLGLVKRSEERRELHAAKLRDEAELAPYIDRVRGALSEPKPEQTVEWLAAKLSLPEATVVRVLDRLRRQGNIEEELNVDSGEWYYFARRQLGEGRGDLESRMAALKQGRNE